MAHHPAAAKHPSWLSPRGLEIMDILYRRGSATAAEIHGEMKRAPTYTTVRGLLRVLEGKGFVKHREDGPRFVYEPVSPREHTGGSYLSHVVRTFFRGSPSDALAALLGGTTGALTTGELKRLEALVAEARKRRP